MLDADVSVIIVTLSIPLYTDKIVLLLHQRMYVCVCGTTHTLANLLNHKDRAQDKYSLSVVYKLTVPDWHKTYVGQTGRQFSTRYKKHMTAWRNHSTTSNFAQHLIEEAHSFGPMNQIKEIVHYHKKWGTSKHNREFPYPYRII